MLLSQLGHAFHLLSRATPSQHSQAKPSSPRRVTEQFAESSLELSKREPANHYLHFTLSLS
jgi:hypothetical protein